MSFFKTAILTLGLALLVLNHSVLAQAVSSDKLTYRNGVAYSKVDNEPYDGDVLNFHSNGQLDFKGGYKNGRKDGIWVGYYFDGQLKYRGRYKNGKSTNFPDHYPAHVLKNNLDGFVDVRFVDGGFVQRRMRLSLIHI